VRGCCFLICRMLLKMEENRSSPGLVYPQEKQTTRRPSRITDHENDSCNSVIGLCMYLVPG
jgi:hypothetical protein